MATLTTANSALALSIRDLFDYPVNIQGYATDDAFATEDIQPTEVMMGVDGILSGGYVPVPTVLTINLQADSQSNNIFDQWLDAMKAAREVYIADVTIILQGTGDKYNLTRGFMTRGSNMPSSRKVLQPRAFQITFQDCSKAPV